MSRLYLRGSVSGARVHFRRGLAAIDRRAPKPSQDAAGAGRALTQPLPRGKSRLKDRRSPQLSSNKVGLLVVAGGRGVRLGADRPKQYLSCAGRPLIVHTLEALTASFPFSAVTVVIGPDDQALYDEAVPHLTASAAAALGPPAIGGGTRQQSVLSGLEALAAAAPEVVLIH